MIALTILKAMRLGGVSLMLYLGTAVSAGSEPVLHPSPVGDNQDTRVEENCPAMSPRVPWRAPVEIDDQGVAVRPAGAAADAPIDFGIQYWGETYNLTTLVEAPHKVLIIEPALIGANVAPEGREVLFSAADVSLMQHGGNRPVYGYLNVGELAPYRDYWVSAFGSAAQTVGDPTVAVVDIDADVPRSGLPGWYGLRNTHGELLSAFWTTEWEAELRRRIDALLERGFDGVFLDDVLHYFTWADEDALAQHALQTGGPRTFAESARQMMSLIIRLSRYARRESLHATCSFAFIVNGGAYIGSDAASDATVGRADHPLFDEYVRAIDAILVENVLAENLNAATILALQTNFAGRGVPVLTVEVLSQNDGLTANRFLQVVKEQASRFGFYTYAARNDVFDRLYAPITGPFRLPW